MPATASGGLGPLAAFPANWHYLLATPVEQQRFHDLIGELIAAELTRGLDATKDINELLEAARAQSCKTWINKSRDQLRQMIAADAFVAEHPEAEVIRAVEKTAAAAEKTEAAMSKAAEAHARATLDKHQAVATQQELHAAQAVLKTGDVVLQRAWQTIQQVRSEAA